MVPVPKAPEAALRQAFIDNGKAIGLEFMEVERETPLSEVRLHLHSVHLNMYVTLCASTSAGASGCSLFHG